MGEERAAPFPTRPCRDSGMGWRRPQLSPLDREALRGQGACRARGELCGSEGGGLGTLLQHEEA